MILADYDEIKMVGKAIENREPIEGLTDEQNDIIKHFYELINEIEGCDVNPSHYNFCDGMRKGYEIAIEDAVRAIEVYITEVYTYFSENNALEKDK